MRLRLLQPLLVQRRRRICDRHPLGSRWHGNYRVIFDRSWTFWWGLWHLTALFLPMELGFHRTCECPMEHRSVVCDETDRRFVDPSPEHNHILTRVFLHNEITWHVDNAESLATSITILNSFQKLFHATHISVPQYSAEGAWLPIPRRWTVAMADLQFPNRWPTLQTSHKPDNDVHQQKKQKFKKIP